MLTLALLTGPVAAQSSAQPLPNPSANDATAGANITLGLPAATYYEAATRSLRRGRSFQRAIAQLTEAARQQPGNADYHLALGCALASRAAALGEAAASLEQFARDKSKYQNWLTAWEAGQRNPDDAAYKQPRPQPPALRTKDDEKPFTLTRGEAAEQFATLATAAVAEWDRALTLAKTDEERAEAYYVRGWGIYLLHNFGEVVASDTVEKLPAVEQALKDLQAATEAAPDEALYWQSLGDLYLCEDGAKSGPALIAAGLDRSGLAAYQRASLSDKRNAGLWYRLYELQSETDPEQAKIALRQAALSDPGNAYPSYRLAGLLFYETPYSLFHKEMRTAVKTRSDIPPREETIKRVLVGANTVTRTAAQEAVACIERGNRAARYAVPTYRPAVPPLLSAAWNFRRHYWLKDTAVNIIVWHTVSVSAEGYALAAAEQKDGAEGVRAALAIIGMGEKMTGNLWERQPPLDTHTNVTLQVSVATTMTGYQTLADVYQILGEDNRAAQARSARADLVQRLRTRRQADNAARQRTYGDG